MPTVAETKLRQGVQILGETGMISQITLPPGYVISQMRSNMVWKSLA